MPSSEERQGYLLSTTRDAVSQLQHWRPSETARPFGDGNILTVYSTFDVSWEFLAIKQTFENKDAPDLLKVLFFYHCEHIRVDIYFRAVEIERKSQIKMSLLLLQDYGAL
ncbi:hypothetical protein P152DRAFT_27998 [Eremomyces bilateralis CBS 781.70]|uniref:Uncharacterized protein n=1 Tax=Eremomyces bilateralis CBS 781.70 TaxID=1392243 RepID=A0A6G1G2F5_9PEZI|nr:uncharacterized protein P152DRAFT_27998 [Eremomyces bilateralis CBS 781.70]KAF1812198.1 hypothetical protein P152DRAFT_27998 [Eremomyces bilateralis CBS 781.70]